MKAQEVQPPPEARGILLEAIVEVSLPLPGNAVSVKTKFLLQPAPSALEVPLSLLTPGPTQLVSLQAYWDGQELSVSRVEDRSDEQEETEPPGHSGSQVGLRLEKVRDHYWEGAVVLGKEAEVGSDSVSLEISFTVEGAWSEAATATLPLLVPRWVPDPPSPRTFLAEVSVPDGHTITGSFPTSVLARPEPGSSGLYEIGLQGVPAMLVLRTSPGSGTFLTLERGLDLLVVMILLAMGSAGLRYLRRREA